MSTSTLSFRRPTSRMRGGLREAVVLAAVAAATTWIALLSWKGFAVEWDGYMIPLLGVGIVVAASGALMRWLRVPGPLIVLAQVLLVGMVVCYQISGALLPLGDDWLRLQLAFEDASASAQQYAAPVPLGVPPVDPLLISGGAACILLVDIVACTMRRVPLAGLPLLTIYSIPVSLLGGGVSWVVFALTSAGFLLMLYLQESRQIARWGRPLGQSADAVDPSGFGVSNGALRSSAGAIGGVATALAIVVPLLIPTFGFSLFGGGFGQGGGDKIKIENPTIDLKRDLERGQDVPMITIHTQDPDPSYLRIVVLNRFSDNEWSPGDREAPTDQRAVGELPVIQGLSGNVPTKDYDYEVQIGQAFDSSWLPTEFPISRIDAAGDWRYDATTMDFMSFNNDLRAAGMDYTMTAVEPDLSAQEMAASSAATDLAGTQLTALPPGLPTIVRQLATQITADQPTRFQKAVALQDFFRDSGNFTYSLDRPAGNGSDTLESFLTPGPDGRTGYCEQFASAMAVMARTINIPSRVAMGFLHPQHVQGDTWVYSAHDLHAWPELYFPGSGWVRFEPTPAAREGGTQPPSYTTFQFPNADQTELPSATASSGDVANRPELSDGNRQDTGNSTTDHGFTVPWRGILIGVGIAVVLVALALVPRLVRRRRRERRLVEGPEPVWLELRDTVVDLGLTWPAGRSPRETGSHLVHYFGPPVGTDNARRPRHGAGVAPEAERALQRIVGTIEMQRYARPGSDQAAILKADAETVIGALEGGVTRGTRRRAEWLPRSLWVSWRMPTRAAVAHEDVTYSGIVDHVG
jgi:transglutaminase-like putative cysteine protease